MSDPSNPAAMLPVGMMGNVDAGSLAALALETVAVRKHLREGDRAPRLWPPHKNGDWPATGPPETFLTEEDMATEFK